jgi:hypothetical protein
MKHKKLIVLFCALLALLGCGKKEIAISSEVGPFNVNSDTGTATGQAFGIEFNVAGASGAAVKSDLSGSPKSSSRTEITLADDVKINLQTMNEGTSVTFDVNGKKFGTLKRGDKVEIEKSRNVMVNGEKRTAEDGSPK